MTSLRQRNRHNAMRLTQRTALDMFISRGFDNVTVGEIADEVGMAASTLYRHFSTKEDIVLWDEHEAGLDKALEKGLKAEPSFASLGHIFATELANRYDEDIDFQLRRVTYIFETTAMHGAAIEADLHDTEELAKGLAHFLPKQQRRHAPLLAAAAMMALDSALDQWQAGRAKEPLGRLITQSFEAVANINELHKAP